MTLKGECWTLLRQKLKSQSHKKKNLNETKNIKDLNLMKNVIDHNL